MKIAGLIPRPESRESFTRTREKFVPARPGCYVLTTYDEVVLYIGLSLNLRKRMNQHLDNPSKTTVTENGRAVLFYWQETSEVHKVERTWLNIHLLNEGKLPVLNRIYSPTHT